MNRSTLLANMKAQESNVMENVAKMKGLFRSIEMLNDSVLNGSEDLPRLEDVAALAKIGVEFCELTANDLDVVTEMAEELATGRT